jgi:hypothetical protein
MLQEPTLEDYELAVEIHPKLEFAYWVPNSVVMCHEWKAGPENPGTKELDYHRPIVRDVAHRIAWFRHPIAEPEITITDPQAQYYQDLSPRSYPTRTWL